MMVVGVHDSMVKVYDSLYKSRSIYVTIQTAAMLKSELEHFVFQIEKT